MKKRSIRRILSLLLALVIILNTSSCANVSASNELAEAETHIEVENIETELIETEQIETEEIITECITTEIYLEEFVEAEDEITELLLQEDMVEEVTMCKTIYVPESNIDEFADNSQISKLFGNSADVKAILKKVAIGTGVIVTVVFLKKVGVNTPIASVVAAAADESVKFALSGAAIGTVFGGFTGAANEIDEAGRIAAVTGFALATVGLIISIVSLVGAIPTGGTSALGVAEGIHLAWAGVKVLLATAGTVYTARDTIKAFTSTEASKIDWKNIDWEQVGYSSAQKAVQNGADGYMWGAIYGTVDGGIEGYYYKYCTPYTKYQNRLKQVPKDGDRGKWTGKRGESDFVLEKPIVLKDGTKITKITYKNAVPDFSPYAKAEVKIPDMTNKRIGTGGNYEKADAALAKQWSKTKYNGKSNWTSRDVENFRENYPYKLTWHEMSNMEGMQLVPYEVNDTFGHCGGVAEYNAMIGKEGVVEYE